MTILHEKQATIKDGFIEALPLAMAIGAYGLSYGILATQAGFTVSSSVIMSLLVFSGSVQMASVSMITAGAGIANVLVTSVLLNMRNLLYGAVLAEGLSGAGKWRWLLCFGVSDEPFVLGSSRFNKYGPDPLFFGVVTGAFYVSWVLSTFIGSLIGDQIDPRRWGLDLAFPITLVALLIPALKGKPVIATAAFAVTLTLGIECLAPGNRCAVILTGVLSPLLGLLLGRRTTNDE